MAKKDGKGKGGDGKKQTAIVVLSASTAEALTEEIDLFTEEVDDFKLKEVQYQSFSGNFSALIVYEGKIYEEEE